MNQWVIIGLIVFWLASILGAEQYGDHARGTKDDLAYQKRDNQTLTAANAKILELQTKYQQELLDHANNLTAIEAKHAKENKDAQNITNSLIADIRNGNLKLRDAEATSIPSGGRTTEQATGPACGCDGTQGGQLSGKASEFLLSLTGEADDTVRQLSACQAVIVEDRK
jgi:hypothetical protein